MFPDNSKVLHKLKRFEDVSRRKKRECTSELISKMCNFGIFMHFDIFIYLIKSAVEEKALY